jgi:hypothetical protein
MSMRPFLARLILLVLLTTAVVAWLCWPGCLSYFNFYRISEGMTREQVQALLGSAGQEVSSDSIPGYAPSVHLPGAPPGWTGVVWGDSFVEWRGEGPTIIIGFEHGKVTSKYYWQPSP